jgi:hypothetical protein
LFAAHRVCADSNATRATSTHADRHRSRGRLHRSTTAAVSVSRPADRKQAKANRSRLVAAGLTPATAAMSSARGWHWHLRGSTARGRELSLGLGQGVHEARVQFIADVPPNQQGDE